MRKGQGTIKGILISVADEKGKKDAAASTPDAFESSRTLQSVEGAALHRCNDRFQARNSCSASPAEDFAGRASVSVISAFLQAEALATQPLASCSSDGAW